MFEKLKKEYSGVYIGENGFGRTLFITHVSPDKLYYTVRAHDKTEPQRVDISAIYCDELNLNTHITLNPRYLYGNNRKTPIKH